MSGLNKTMLIGFLGADPELRYTQNNQGVCNFRLATNETWNDKQGTKQTRPEWHKIQAWGKLAEICSKYLHKGSQVYIEGRLTTREWDDRDGNKRTSTEIVAKEVVFLGGQGDYQGGGNARQNADQQPASSPPRQQQQQQGQGNRLNDPAPPDDDYPFR